MPSHKHKKSKKKNKHQTKQNSTFLHKILTWNERFSNSDSESSENEDRLTNLVRRSYTNHLQEALIQNLTICINSSSRFTSDLIDEMVEKWSSTLEKKALKACTIKEQYRKNMVSLIKHIKAATDDKKMCFEEQSILSLITTLPSNKETQTENDPKMVTAETQTDCTIACVSSSQPWDAFVSNQDVCSITSTSDLYPPKLTTNSINIDNTHNKNTIGGLSEYINSIESDYKHSLSDTFSEEINFVKNNKISDETFDQIGDSSGQLQEHSFINLRQSFEPNMCEMNTQNNFDFNLSAVGSLGDIDKEHNLNQLTSLKYKKSNWYAEETAQMCNLTRILLQMSTSRRGRVINIIKELFGDIEVSLAELTVKNITICRKRIASAVVMELTPIYKSKRIASRKLFKYLAQKITTSIMEQSYAPDTRVVRWKVREFFSGGKIITNESDCK